MASTFLSILEYWTAAAAGFLYYIKYTFWVSNLLNDVLRKILSPAIHETLQKI